MNEKLVTIIVPIYNVEKYLRECIESIINQNYKNIEIILVNDGSTDSSLKICEEYKKRDSRIIIIDKENGGLSDARNTGINIAKGEYICFVDSDDYIEYNYIDLLCKEAEENNSDIVICGVKNIDDQKQILNEYSYESNCIKSGRELLFEYYKGRGLEVIVAWNKLYKRELFDNYRFDIGKIHEDEFLIYKILYPLKKVSIISNILYCYRKNNESIINKKFNLKRLDLIDALDERMKFFKEKCEYELYTLTLELYTWVLKDSYIKIKNNIKDSKKINDIIMMKYKSMKKKFLRNNKIKEIQKTKYLIFYFFHDIISELKRFQEKEEEMNIIKIIKIYVKKMLYKYMYMRYKNKCKKKNKKEFILFNTPIHGNIGDHAILLAELELLKNLDIDVFEIPTYEEEYIFDFLSTKIDKNAVILITGGGLIGSQWVQEEKLINKTIDYFCNNKIIIFPSTFYFKENENGKKELEKSKFIINKAKDITIFAREKNTFDFILNNYQIKNTFLIPDIVLNLKCNFNKKRKYVLLCFRADVEGIMKKDDIVSIEKIVQERDQKSKKTDTVVNYAIPRKKTKREVEKKLLEFSASKLVITDRLHGMIFSIITNTPCIVFGNYNYKIKGVFEKWVSGNIENVIFLENIIDIEKSIDRLLNLKTNKKYEFNFEPLINVLKESKKNG